MPVVRITGHDSRVMLRIGHDAQSEEAPTIGSVTVRRVVIAVAAMIASLVPRTAAAQLPVARVGPSTAISGVVFDSVAQKPLVSARVELVNADSMSAPPKSIETDTLGNFRLDGVRPGRYLIGFTHPMLDSIGVEQAPRAVAVDGRSVAMRVDLAVPSPRSLRVAICGAAAVADSQSLIIGIVRDAGTRAAVASSTVAVEWANFTIAAGGLKRSSERRTFVTQETGWFALCGAPASGTILLSASHDADSTEALQFEMPVSGFLRRDLFFGVARQIAADTVARVADSLAMPPGPRRSGDGRVSGSVVAAEGGRPLSGARVGIRNGPETRTDERGVFTLSGLPTGTRMLDVRAVAFAPLELPVDIVDGAAPLRIPLVSLKALLDTVKVRANLVDNRDEEEFLRRKKRSGAGRFMTAEDIAKRNVILAADLFRSMPGVTFARDENQYDILVQRSMSSMTDNPFCRVSVFVNGFALRDPTVNDLNAILRPNEMRGVEVYDGGAAPPEYSRRNGCGSVVIWTR